MAADSAPCCLPPRLCPGTRLPVERKKANLGRIQESGAFLLLKICNCLDSLRPLPYPRTWEPIKPLQQKSFRGTNAHE
jgi:hypothetical protein